MVAKKAETPNLLNLYLGGGRGADTCKARLAQLVHHKEDYSFIVIKFTRVCFYLKINYFLQLVNIFFLMQVTWIFFLPKIKICRIQFYNIDFGNLSLDLLKCVFLEKFVTRCLHIRFYKCIVKLNYSKMYLFRSDLGSRGKWMQWQPSVSECRSVEVMTNY